MLAFSSKLSACQQPWENHCGNSRTYVTLQLLQRCHRLLSGLPHLYPSHTNGRRLAVLQLCHIFSPFFMSGHACCRLRNVHYLEHFLVSFPWWVLFNNLVTDLSRMLLCAHDVAFFQEIDSRDTDVQKPKSLVRLWLHTCLHSAYYITIALVNDWCIFHFGSICCINA